MLPQDVSRCGSIPDGSSLQSRQSGRLQTRSRYWVRHSCVAPGGSPAWTTPRRLRQTVFAAPDVADYSSVAPGFSFYIQVPIRTAGIPKQRSCRRISSVGGWLPRPSLPGMAAFKVEPDGRPDDLATWRIPAHFQHWWAASVPIPARHALWSLEYLTVRHS